MRNNGTQAWVGKNNKRDAASQGDLIVALYVLYELIIYIYIYMYIYICVCIRVLHVHTNYICYANTYTRYHPLKCWHCLYNDRLPFTTIRTVIRTSVTALLMPRRASRKMSVTWGRTVPAYAAWNWTLVEHVDLASLIATQTHAVKSLFEIAFQNGM